MSTDYQVTITCEHGDGTQKRCRVNRVMHTDVHQARAALATEGWRFTQDQDLCPGHDQGAADPISPEAKRVAVAIFGERLLHKTPDAGVAIENVASAVAAELYPDSPDHPDRRALRTRFIGMCLNDVTVTS